MKVAFIGGGNMANAIVGGLVASGRKGADFLVVDVDANARGRMAASHGVATAAAPGPELKAAEVVVLAVKPQQMKEVARSAAAHCGAGALFVSIAAGIRLADLSRWLGGRTRLVRAMPNTPALVHAGVTGLFAAPGVPQADRDAAEALLRSVGSVVWFPREEDLDAVTAVSASGPAYVLYAIEALEEAAREVGLEAAAARELALATFAGAAKLAVERGEDPRALRAQVTSKGGTTEAALEVLEGAGVKQDFVDAVKAARDRAREMGDLFGKD